MKDNHDMENINGRVTAGQVRLQKAIKLVDEISDLAEEGAAEMCNAGEFELGAALHDMDALLSEAYAKLRQAYAIGRRLKTKDGKFVAESGTS